MNATLDGNKWCDIAYGCRNNATENVLCNKKQKAVQQNIRVCNFFFGLALYIQVSFNSIRLSPSPPSS